MKKIIFCIFIILFGIFICFIIQQNKSNLFSMMSKFPLFKNTAGTKTVIKFSSWGSQSEIKILKQLINEFEELNPNINIEFIHIPQNYFQKIQLLFASNQQPDVVFFNNQYIKMYIKANLLEDLTPYIDKNLFYKEALDCFTYNNKIYAIPRDISTLVIYYNKEILKSAGINPYKDFEDLNSLKESIIKLSDKNHFGINFEEDPLFWSYYLASNSGGIISDDVKNIIITKEKSLEALQLYSNLVNKYHAAPSKAQTGSMTTAQMFMNKKLAMYLSGRWMVPIFRRNLDFEWDIAEFPASDDNRVYLDSSGWAVSKKSKHKDAAIKFIEYLSSESSMEKLGESGLIIPAEIKAAKNIIKNDKSQLPEHSSIFLDMIQRTKPTPVNENSAMINDIIKEKIQPLFLGQKKAEEVFDEKTIKKIESLL